MLVSSQVWQPSKKMPITLYTEVKLPGRSLAATNVAGPSPIGRLFYVYDKSTALRFLVDTGAQVSIIPPSSAERSAGPGELRLQAINGSNIPTFGLRSLTLDLGLLRAFRWVLSSPTYLNQYLVPISSTTFVYWLTCAIAYSPILLHSYEFKELLVEITYSPVSHLLHRTTPTHFSNFCPNSRQSRSHAPLIARSSTL